MTLTSIFCILPGLSTVNTEKKNINNSSNYKNGNHRNNSINDRSNNNKKSTEEEENDNRNGKNHANAGSTTPLLSTSISASTRRGCRSDCRTVGEAMCQR